MYESIYCNMDIYWEHRFTVGETNENCLLWLSIYTCTFNAARALTPICSAHGQPKQITINDINNNDTIQVHGTTPSSP